jgi:hypothetical protein
MKSRRRAKSKPLAPTPAAVAVAKPASNGCHWWVHVVILLGLLLGNLALYHRTIDLGFLTVDDPDYVQNNTYIEKLNRPNLKFILTKPYAANYAPANLLSYALDVALAGGKKPSAIHLSSVMWHGWVVCMVYLLAFTIRANIFSATAAALLFMLHPAHVEVVAWISSRKDLVATGFAVLSMACYLKARKSCHQGDGTNEKSLSSQGDDNPSNKPAVLCRLGSGTAWYLASLSAFLLGSAAKQSVILLPGVMLVWDILVEKRRSWKMFADKIPFGLITIFFGWMTWHAQPSTNQAPNVFILAATQLANLRLLTGLGQYTLFRPAPDPAAWRLTARIVIILAAVAVWLLPLLLLRARKDKTDPASQTPPPVSFATRPLSLILIALFYWILLNMIPPMVLSFLVPITDRYLFLPSVGICLFLATVPALFSLSPSEGERAGVRGADSVVAPRTKPYAHWLGITLFAAFAAIWATKTCNYVTEWSDPRSVWYGAHFKTKNSQVSQFLGEIYHNAGDRVDAFIKAGAPIQLTNDLPIAQAVLADKERAASLRAEWVGDLSTRTNSTAYRDLLWASAWQQYQDSAAHRGKLSAPNLFMNRGRLLVSQGKFDKAVPEFQIALAFAQTSSYDVIRQESVIHALRAIGTCYWHMRNYKEAVPWFLKAQDIQRKSGKPWIATLDQEVDKIKSLAASQP